MICAQNKSYAARSFKRSGECTRTYLTMIERRKTKQANFLTVCKIAKVFDANLSKFFAKLKMRKKNRINNEPPKEDL